MKMDFDQVLEALADQVNISREDVKASDLKRKVWVNANGLPGCMYDHQGINMTKADAIASCKLIADEYPRGFVSSLRNNYHAYIDGYRYSIYKASIDELI